MVTLGIQRGVQWEPGPIQCSMMASESDLGLKGLAARCSQGRSESTVYKREVLLKIDFIGGSRG